MKKLFTLSIGITSLFIGLVIIVFAEENPLEEKVQELFQSSESRLNTIESLLQEQTQKYFEAQENITEIEKLLHPLRNKKASLETQLEFFEEQNTLAETKIQNVEIQMNKKRIEIAKLQELIERAEVEIQEEKNMLMYFIKQIYLEERKYYESDSAVPEFLKLLLSDATVSQSLQEIEFLEITEALGRNIFHRLDQANTLFLEKKNELEESKKSLNALKLVLEKEKYNILVQKQGREKLFFETEGQEQLYQKLLESSKKEADAAILAVANLRDNRDLIQEKLGTVQENSTTEQQEVLKDILKQSPDLQDYNIEDLTADYVLQADLMWPVNPNRGITAYFLDKDYKEYFGVPHKAIDIRSVQGTPIYAPASAYVQEIADNGLGYSYILLAHKNGLSTLYGHVSEILVEEGQLLQMGTVIGKTGGTPGTLGAGVMTTGPHLHFEVHKDGNPVDPLDYLPLDLLPSQYQ